MSSLPHSTQLRAPGDAAPLRSVEELETLVAYQGSGLRLRGTALWFDGETARDLCFVSHALVRRARQHARVLASQLSERLLQALHRTTGHASPRRRILAVPLKQRFSIGELSLELLPSGYLLGASSMLVQWRGTTLLYSGPLGATPSALAEPPEPHACDLLVLHVPKATRAEITLANSARRRRALLDSVHTTLAGGLTPVVVAPPVGTAQYLASLLLASGMQIRVHPQIRAVARVYADVRRGLDPSQLGQLRRFDSSVRLDPKRRPEVLLWPAQLAHSQSLRRLEDIRIEPLVETSRTVGPDAATRAALVAYVQACGPQHVLLCGFPSAALLAQLRAAGASVGICQRAHQLEMF